jgi:hypothetical protein
MNGTNFGIGLILGILATILIISTWKRFLPPIPDPGHRLFGVRSEKAAAVLLRVMEQHGMNAVMAFDAGPTHQVVLTDQRTVIAWFDLETGNLEHNAISLAVSNPQPEAERALKILQDAGFEASATTIPMNGTEHLAVVASNAFDGNVLVFRKPWYKLGRPKQGSLPRLDL